MCDDYKVRRDSSALSVELFCLCLRVTARSWAATPKLMLVTFPSETHMPKPLAKLRPQNIYLLRSTVIRTRLASAQIFLTPSLITQYKEIPEALK